MLTKEQKQELVNDLVDKFSKTKLTAFIDFSYLNVAQISDLRKKLRELGADLKVAKKRLIDLALEKVGLKEIKVKEFEGQIALVFGYEDEIAPAKAIYQFSLKNEPMKILGGVLDGQFLGKDQILFLAKLSSREQLLSKLVSCLNAPLSGLVSVLNGNLRNFVYLLSKIKS